jgi:hypothetical protein
MDGRSVLLRRALLALAVTLPAGAVPAQWLDLVDETATRIVSDPALGVADVEEKDYAWGDVDNDGDVDLVVVRKEPFTSPGKRTNVLFLNEGGVLVDRTLQYVTASTVGGDQGFLTPTNDRDVQLVDLSGDGWLDIVTAVTISDGDPKHIGHPRLYINLGENGSGDWLGFQHRNNLMPTMVSYTNQTGFNPRFCSVAVGDVTGDDRPDLWFGDYDSSGAGGFEQPEGADFNDRLLVNGPNARFVDATVPRFLGTIQIPNSDDQPFEISAFGAAGAIADMNGDGFNDIVKQTSLTSPLYVGIAYNNPANEGVFDTYEVVNNQSPYFISVGDLNKDSLLDIVITDDGADRFLLIQGNGADGLADFVSFNFAFDAASDDGFGSNSVIADLNDDTWPDVLIADVDVDISGCSRRMHVYRNLGGTPGGPVTLREETSGTGCQTSAGNPASCLVASIPADKLEGVHDVAVFDLDGDGRKDLIVGRCTGTEVYMNRAPLGLAFSYPLGLPFFVPPGQTFTFQVRVQAFGGTTVAPGTVKLFVSVDGAPFTEHAVVDLGGELYEATLPAAPNCTDSIEFYLSADAAAGGGTFLDPAAAPGESYAAVAALGSVTSFEDDVEGDVSGWSVVNDPSLAGGGWEPADPLGTFTGGQLAAPDEDAEAAQDKVMAFVTQNGAPGGAVGDADVDGGPTDLVSPPINLAGTDGLVSFSRWFFSTGADEMEIAVTSDGSNWQVVETVDPAGNNAWSVSTFRVGDWVVPSGSVQVRFRVDDTPNDSVTEAGIDLFSVRTFACSSCSLPAECADTSFCNGDEQCVGGLCVPGSDPCPGQQCDEGADACADCFADGDCNDGAFCSGVETCNAAACESSGNPCPGQQCDEANDLCLDCLVDQHCDDGLFCNGAESCVGGTCRSPAEACPGQLCDEDNDLCIGTTVLQPRMGDPLLGLTGEQAARFAAGRVAFSRTFDAASGLGPTFNQNSCGTCHNTPSGGSGSIVVTRFGHSNPKGGGFDPLASQGGSLLQAEALTPACEEPVPAQANVTASRLTNSTLGFGLVEAIDDADISANAILPPAGVSGVVHSVEALENPGTPRVGRFGWKSQVPTVLSFSADAALNEMGITNRLVTAENAPNGDLVLLAACDGQPDPEDGPDAEGFHFIDRVTDFQRFLAPPPQTPRSGMTGETRFNAIGCNACHISVFSTRDDVLLEDAIRDRPLKPYSDFLLHDMGLNGDFIAQGGAGETELRTAPLWGLRARDPLWHDGRVSGGTFTSRVTASIGLHNAVGSEAQNSALAYQALSAADKSAVIAFLDSLGRAEFDHDGDNDVDGADHAQFLACFTGPGGTLVPDDPCSISDVDRDGDVDDDDFSLFLAAADVPAGSVPDGANVPGTPLIVNREPGGELTLTWGASCAAADEDYAVYEGTLRDFTSHRSKVCGTSGATSATFTPDAGDTYYLVVPLSAFREGSYGADSSGAERPQGAMACFPRSVGHCD